MVIVIAGGETCSITRWERKAMGKTDLEALTLSDEDRELFLKGKGLRSDLSEQKAEEIRAKWPDKIILELIGAGLF